MININNKEIVKALRTVTGIRDYYSKNSSDFGRPCCVSTRDLIDVCERYVGEKIQIFTGEYGPLHSKSHFETAYLRSDNLHRIWFSPRLDKPWLRYAIAKELMHVVLSCPEFRSLEVAETRESYVKYYLEQGVRPGLIRTSTSDSVAAKTLTSAALAEGLAQVAAMEFHLPYASRLGHKNISDQCVAELYELPVELIAKFRSPSMMTALDITSED